MSNKYSVAIAAAASFIALIVGFAAGRGSLDGLQAWQTALGAFIALVAIIVTAWNVSRQLRMNLITREEALMEERHPGLQQALNFVTFLNLKLGVADIQAKLPTILQEYDARGLRDVVTETLEKALPLTDTATKFSILAAFYRLNFAADLIEEGSDLNRMRFENMKSGDEQPDETVRKNAASMIAQGRGYLDEEVASLSRLEVTLGTRLNHWNERLPRFRSEIEAYFK